MERAPGLLALQNYSALGNFDIGLRVDAGWRQTPGRGKVNKEFEPHPAGGAASGLGQTVRLQRPQFGAFDQYLPRGQARKGGRQLLAISSDHSVGRYNQQRPLG